MHIPLFCPNPECALHNPAEVKKKTEDFYILFGEYETKVVGSVQRFKCCTCGKGFSERTFMLDYYTKKTLPYKDIMRAFSSSESISSMARDHTCSVNSVQNRLERLSRNGLLFHIMCLQSIKLKEGLVADGFESFDVSQFHPNNINILVGEESQYLYGLTHVTLRRKGRMTEEQKKKRESMEKIFKPPRGCLKKSFVELVQEIPSIWDPKTLVVLNFKTDEHKTYPVALQQVADIKKALSDGTFVHLTYSSKDPRTTCTPLFPVNYYDREYRKDVAAFHRESVCFTRNVASGMSRIVCHLIYHNYCKEFRINWGQYREPVHAAVAGVSQEKIDTGLEGLFTNRLFYTHFNVSPLWHKIWNREYPTPFKKREEYLPKFVRIIKKI